MDFKRLVNEASSKLSRAVQKTEETFLSAEKTEYDFEYKTMLQKLDLLNLWTDKFIKETSVALEPNLANRLEDKMYDKIDRKNERPTPLEILGSSYEKASESFRPYTEKLSKCFSVFGGIEMRVGVTNKEFQKRINEVYILKLKSLMNNELKKFQDARNTLENLRLDLDANRSKLKRASESNKSSIEESLNKAEMMFKQQLEDNKKLFAEIDQIYVEHENLIKAFVNTQINYYSECQKELERLEKQL